MKKTERGCIFLIKIVFSSTKRSRNGKKELDIAYFISFCIEQYKVHISANGNEVMDLFDKYGVTEYLSDNFEILHTQSRQWLLEEIDDFIQQKKEEIG